jgi:hypothetical protein
MFQARIVSPRGSLYFAAEATPYDLENLRSHVHDLQSPKARDVRLELSLDETRDPLMERRVASMIERLAAEGIQITLAPTADSAPLRQRSTRSRG